MNKEKIIFLLLMAIIIAGIIALIAIKEPLGSNLRYLYRGPVGQKYIYWMHDNKIRYAVVAGSKEGAKDIAKVINNNGKDSFNFNSMKIGTYISCNTKDLLRDTLRIDGILFAMIKYTHGVGRLTVDEYYYVPETFLFDDVIGECPENK